MVLTLYFINIMMIIGIIFTCVLSNRLNRIDIDMVYIEKYILKHLIYQKLLLINNYSVSLTF